MHTNYYFLRQLAPLLTQRLTGLLFMECFSQDRDEVVLVFAEAKGKVNYYKPFYVKATLRPDFSGLYFPADVHRARTNSVDLFGEVTDDDGAGRAVLGVGCFLNERCLRITLSGGYTMVFKFFGNRPNLLAFRDDEVVDLFNHNLSTDTKLRLSQFDRPIDQSYNAYEASGFDLRKVFPTFGKAAPATTDWPAVQQTLALLDQPRYYLTRSDHKPTLWLIPPPVPPGPGTEGVATPDVNNTPTVQIFDDPIEAANRFYVAYNGLSVFDREKADLLRLIDKRRRRAAALIEANLLRLLARDEGASHEEMGHILMANLHDIPAGAGTRSPERVTLHDFYRDQPITLKLKQDLSPQKNAENFYRKAKNEKIEEEHLTEQIDNREAEIQRIDQYKQDVAAIKTLKELRRYVKQHHLDGNEAAPVDGEAAPLFKEVIHEGFRILIGRNAKNNDLLTQKYTYKDDLWLHARDVSGSHVVIKYQAGKTFPKSVIERAAELAAWYSKRRTDSLCPVTVTPKKYVRKPKGLAPGQVIVEKEDVVMVVPHTA